MKYTTKVKQIQKVAGIRIEPKGGDLNEDQLKKIAADKYGKDLIDKGMLVIEGLAKPAAAPAPAQTSTQGSAAANVPKA